MTRLSDRGRRVLQAVGVNRAVAYGLLGLAGTVLFQPVTLLLITVYLSPQEQGYYYAFGAVVGLQSFFELGLGTAAVQFMSHEAIHLSWTADGRLAGDDDARSRLASIVRLLFAWYAVIAGVLVAVLLAGGWFYFLQRDDGQVAWRFPWVWTVIVSAAALLTLPPILFLTACGKIAEGARAQAFQKIAANCALCLLLAAGGGLFSSPIAQSLAVGGVLAWLGWTWGPALIDMARPADGPKIRWWGDVWPFQWRIAAGSLAFYLTTSLWTLVLFDGTPEGKAEAGRMGASLQVMSVLTAGAVSWVGARLPIFGYLTARRDWAGLDRVFRRVFLQSVLVAAAAAIAAWVAFAILRAAGVSLGLRVLPGLPLALLMANVVVQTIVSAFMNYLRAHKREPFVWVYLGFAAAAVGTLLVFGRSLDSLGMAAVLLGLNTTICLGAGGFVFARCRRAWHMEPVAELPDPVPA
jgi:hypothetical protein